MLSGISCKLFSWLVAACLTLISFPSKAQKASEYQVKAAFLFNFSKFLEWPPSSFTDAGPFLICIAGKDPFGNFLSETIAGEKAFGRDMAVMHHTGNGRKEKCHIAYISSSGNTAEMLAAHRRKGVLTVGDDPNFCRKGGIIRFYTENNMIRLEINTEAAKEAELHISSKLLRIAKIYK